MGDKGNTTMLFKSIACVYGVEAFGDSTPTLIETKDDVVTSALQATWQ